MATKVAAPPHDVIAPQIAQEVQQLFESSTIDDIRKIESRTRKEVEDKRQELRKLIGARYRDLIESADSIVIMNQNADQLHSKIQTMRGDLDQGTGEISRIAQLMSGNRLPKSPQVREKSSKAKLFSSATKIKAILETPELIWSALEREKHLEATLFYHQAQVLHSVLQADPESVKRMATVPVIPRQWALVGQFPAKIDAAIKSFLARPDQHPEQYAAALCAIAMLDKPAPSLVFAEFLEARSKLLSTIQPPAKAKDMETIMQHLRSCTNIITTTFLLIYYIFVCPSSQQISKNSRVHPHSAKDPAARTFKHAQSAGPHIHSTIPPTPPYLYSILQTVKDDTNAIFKAHSIEPTEHEIASNDTFFSLHIPLSSIQTQSEQWLARSAQQIQTVTHSLLSHLDTAQGLAQARDGVRTSLSEFLRSDTDASWTTVCQSVAGHEVDLWNTLFMDKFLERAREIVAHSFQTVDFVGALTSLVKDPIAGVGTGLWGAEGSRDAKDTAAIRNKAAGFTPSVRDFVQKFDAMLERCVADITHLTRQPQPQLPPPSPTSVPPASPLRLSSSSSMLMSPSIGTSRALTNSREVDKVVDMSGFAALETYVQDRCFDGITTFLGVMGKRLEVLQAIILAPPVSDSTKTPPSTSPLSSPAANTPTEEERVKKAVDEALLIAQAARALSMFSKQLASALSPAGSTAITLQSPSTPVRTPSRKPKPNEKTEETRLDIIKKALKQRYMHGYVLWSHWVTTTHTQWLSACVRRDTWNDANRRQGWEEQKVTMEGEDGNSIEERLYIPFQPSPYVLEFLFNVSREIHRAGGHTIRRAVLEYLARELARSVLILYDGIAENHQGGGASKEGGVQLLCDACFLMDVLSVADDTNQIDEALRAVLVTLPARNDSEADLRGSGEEVRSAIEERLASAIAWGRRVDSTIGRIKDLLDPIDLAFYEPHIKSFVERCYQRTSVLFGALVQLHKAHESRTKVPAISDPNIIPLAKPIARFGYLPISVPTPVAPLGALQAQGMKPEALHSGDGAKKPAGPRSLMEQVGAGSLKTLTSLNSMLGTFTTTASPPPNHPGGTQQAAPGTAPPKIPGLWFL